MGSHATYNSPGCLRMRILIVEDEVAAGSLLQKGLQEIGHAVDLAVDGEEALYKSSISDYDCIILDVMLPKLNGLRVCEQLRRSSNCARILMLTARDSWEDKVKGLDTGADDYLTKPFRYPELLARLRALHRRGPLQHTTIVRVADLELKVRSRSVTRGGRRLDLTQKEYALLEYLMQHSGEVISRSEIAEHVWDENYDPFSNLIEVYVQRLRKKVDSEHSQKLIHTRRGIGYVLAEEGDDSVD